MRTYLIGYDLNKNGQNYDPLISAIKQIAYSNLWWHCLDSTWIIKTNSAAIQIRDSLKNLIDSNDELLVVCLDGEGAWTGFNNECSDWLYNNLK